MDNEKLDVKTIKVGEKLPNGNRFIGMIEGMRGVFSLELIEDALHDKFCTHLINVETRETVSGNYFPDMLPAYKDLIKRAGKPIKPGEEY